MEAEKAPPKLPPNFALGNFHSVVEAVKRKATYIVNSFQGHVGNGAPASYSPPPVAPLVVKMTSLVIAVSSPLSAFVSFYLPLKYLVFWGLFTGAITAMEGQRFVWKHGSFFSVGSHV